MTQMQLQLKQNLKVSNLQPIYSPRSTMSMYLQQLFLNKTSLVINIDKEVLNFFKDQFENYNNKMTKIEFIREGSLLLKSWQKDMPGRSAKIIKYLSQLFDEASQKQIEENKKENHGKKNIEQSQSFTTWQQFNRMMIDKALNLKSLQTNQSDFVSFMKSTSWSRGHQKLPSSIQKVICLNKQKKLAYLCEQSNKIQFLSLFNNQHNHKPIVIGKQELVVQKSMLRRVKDDKANSKNNPIKQNYKKEVIVSNYRINFLDMIHISNQKYQLLLTSSTDFIVRGWDINGSTPTLAKQPQSQDEKMIHQFPVQIHCMVWDEINEILYCSGKNFKIYLWMVKTDSQRELVDPQCHTTMISSMIMMPKLQFLASGGDDGKLILWDTISLTKKFKYQEHQRSIVSMTFHEGLILLFTASFDHSICVWNPYIPSLIYKIPCNINVIQVQIIHGTNYLAALDSASNLKIREINKFTLVSSFVVDRPEDTTQHNKNKELAKNDAQEQQNRFNIDTYVKIEPTCMGISKDNVRFYFGGNSIKCLDFDENQALMASQYFPTFLQYNQQTKKLYVSIKNNLLVWDMLTGRLIDILSLQTENQITAIDFIHNSGLFVVGDSQGSIYMRKLENGIKITQLYQSKTKSSLIHLKSKNGGIWNQSVIIGCTQDCEIIVFGKDKEKDYIYLRNLSPKKYLASLSFISAIQYEQKRNILIIGCGNGDLLFMDVDKNRVTNHIQQQSLGFYASMYKQQRANPQIINISIKKQIPSILCINKGNQVFGIYLPPHFKKFKPSCQISFAKNQRISAVYMCQKSNKFFLGYQNGMLVKMQLILEQQENQSTIYEEWSVNLTEVIKILLLIEEETVIVTIVYGKNITLLSAATGELLNILPSHGLVGSSLSDFGPDFKPICYYDENSKEIYDPKTRNRAKIASKQSCSLQLEKDLRFFHDPFYIVEEYQKFFMKPAKNQPYQTKQNLISNGKWKVQPKFRLKVQQNIQQIRKIGVELKKRQQQEPKIRLRRNMSLGGSIQKAHQIQNKWEKNKQMEEQKINEGKTLFKMTSFGLKTFKGFNKSSLHSNQRKQAYQKKQEIQQQYISSIKHQSLHKMESSPLFRLGMALKSVDHQDKKAMKFLEMANNANTSENSHKKKNILKFPKIK